MGIFKDFVLGKAEVAESGLKRWTEAPVDIHPGVTWVRMSD